MKQKPFLLIAGTILIILGVVGVMIFTGNKSTDSSSQVSSEKTQVTQRHDNSGAGSQDSNPLQEHFGRAMQHLGL